MVIQDSVTRWGQKVSMEEKERNRKCVVGRAPCEPGLQSQELTGAKREMSQAGTQALSAKSSSAP